LIRSLAEDDRDEVMALLTPESGRNVFIIGDVENYGFRTEFQELWGDFDSAGKLRAVLLRYYGSFIPYAPAIFNVDGLAGILLRQRGRMTAFSGLDRVIQSFEACPGILPPEARRRRLFLMELSAAEDVATFSEPQPQFGAGLGAPERAVPDDVPSCLALWRLVDGSAVAVDMEQSLRLELQTGAARLYMFRSHGQVVAMARTTAENSRAAVITGVATHPDYRRRGLATHLLAILGRELLSEGKRPCLFYDNPEAGSIYRRLGFLDIGVWVMYAIAPR
jgi:predicted GNAT family acetyltransferase